MKVTLAGYNVDTTVLAELTQGQSRPDVTPETLSAAYARISRDPRPVSELRQVARQEVEKARRSNANIIFKMGHHSVAEHAVFNFDILGISRLALEELEKFRLCAYTEKSQRYQKLAGEYVVPPELQGSAQEKLFIKTITRQNQGYQALINQGIEPEDARYATSLATQAQLGMTLNARNLELLIRRFASSQLTEIRQLGEAMYQAVVKIAPSIVLFTAANDLDQKTYPELKSLLQGRGKRKRVVATACTLVDYTAGADHKLVTALVHTVSGLSYLNCRRLVKKMSASERLAIIKKANQYLEFYDATLREYEHVSLTYDLVVSSGCFGQLKRHRMATITAQTYQPALGVTVPPAIKKAGQEKEFMAIVEESEAAFAEISQTQPAVAPYLLTAAHRKRVLMTLNARELYHLSRLREDVHAQWDIQQLAMAMTAGAKKIMPLTMLLIGGKDSYAGNYQKVYGRPPRLLPPAE